MKFLTLLLTVLLPASAFGMEPTDTLTTDSVRKRPWAAAAEVAAINMIVMGYDHLFMDLPCYRVTAKDIKNNFQVKNWWWDSDYIHTNALNHPYHGSLYYTAARDNGMGIGVSSLMTAAGCLTWELLCEAEPPSFNDLISTPVGGITLGEPMHRISNKVLDDSKRGVERIGREVVAFVIDPVKGLNRLIRGDSWRVRSNVTKRKTPMETNIELGFRRLAVSNQKGINTAFLLFDFDYGDAMGQEGCKPFDYFTVSLKAVAGKKQPLINSIRVKNQLWTHVIGHRDRPKAVVGLYNHYDYILTHPDYEGSKSQRLSHPMGYLEVASIGPGFIYRTGNNTRFEQLICVNGIGLGATPIDAQSTGHNGLGYSFGSGYGACMTTDLRIGRWLHATFNGKFSQLFTWDGFYADDPSRKPRTSYSSIQGEEGNTVNIIVDPSLEIMPYEHVGIALHGSYFRCHSNNKYHPHTTTHFWELYAGVRYRF